MVGFGLKRFLVFVLCMPILAFSIFVCTSTEDTGESEFSAYEQETFRRINTYRNSKGRGSLQYNDIIAREALLHSDAMATGDRPFGHDKLSNRIENIRQVMQVSDSAENITYNQSSTPVEYAVQTWLNSPDDLINIEGDFTFTGVGIAQGGNGVLYFTQIFIK